VYEGLLSALAFDCLPHRRKQMISRMMLIAPETGMTTNSSQLKELSEQEASFAALPGLQQYPSKQLAHDVELGVEKVPAGQREAELLNAGHRRPAGHGNTLVAPGQ